MQATLQGGLSGKARLNRHRNRVHRMHAQQMLEEYYDEEAGDAPERPIPLRGRAEFLPTIDRWTQEDSAFEGVAVESGSQLELTLTVDEETKASQPQQRVVVVHAESTQSEVVTPRRELETVEPVPALQDVETTADADESARPPLKVIPAPYWARPRASFQPQGGRKVDPVFDLRRFGYGCALGSAAAAAILFVVSVVIH